MLKFATSRELRGVCSCYLNVFLKPTSDGIDSQQKLLLAWRRFSTAPDPVVREAGQGQVRDGALERTAGRSHKKGVDALVSTLGISYIHAHSIVRKYPAFQDKPSTTLSVALERLQMHEGCSVERVLKHPWLLLTRPDVLDEQLRRVVSILSLKPVVALPLVCFNIGRVLRMGSQWKSEAKTELTLLKRQFRNRVEYLSFKLQCPQTVVADMLVQVSRLGVINFRKMETTMEDLLQGGVDPKDIIEDPWIFLHNMEVMRERIKSAQENRLPEIKPWMLRCSDSKYETYVERVVEEQRLTREGGIASYLQRRLGWNAELVNSVLQKTPTLVNINAVRLERMISFLLSKGYTAEDIALCSRILRQSVAGVAQRLSEVSEVTHLSNSQDRVASLRIFCESSRRFQKFMDGLDIKRDPGIPPPFFTNTMEQGQSNTPTHGLE